MSYEQELNTKLHKEIIGQDAAIAALVQAVVVAKLGVTDPERPLGTFMFLGPSGVGKSQLGRSLAAALHPDDTRINIAAIKAPGLRVFNCTEFQAPHEVSKLMGAPPGYVGYDNRAALLQEDLEAFGTVVIFEEIEKANVALYSVLLELMEKGILVTGSGTVLDFRKCFIIFTSNLGSEALDRQLSGNIPSFGLSTVNTAQDQKQVCMKALESHFSPEFINRLDTVITFGFLKAKDYAAILDKFVAAIQTRFFAKRITLRLTEAAKKFILQNGVNKRYGARPLRRALVKYIDYPVASLVAERRGEIYFPMTIKVDLDSKQAALTYTVTDIGEMEPVEIPATPPTAIASLKHFTRCGGGKEMEAPQVAQAVEADLDYLARLAKERAALSRDQKGRWRKLPPPS